MEEKVKFPILHQEEILMPKVWWLPPNLLNLAVKRIITKQVFKIPY